MGKRTKGGEFFPATDYGYPDPSSELNAIRLLRNDKRITPAATKKILETNPRKFYGLN